MQLCSGFCGKQPKNHLICQSVCLRMSFELISTNRTKSLQEDPRGTQVNDVVGTVHHLHSLCRMILHQFLFA